MMLCLTLQFTLAILFWSSSLHGSVIPDTHVEHENRDWEGHGFSKHSEADGSLKVTARVGLAQSNLETGHDLLMDISHPDSPRFGKHLSREEVDKFFEPQADTINSIAKWIHKTIKPKELSLAHNKQWIRFVTSISDLEELLHTKFYYYQAPVDDTMKVGCDRYHVPIELQKHIDFITPGVVPLAVRPIDRVKRKTPQRRHVPRRIPEEPVLDKRAAQATQCPIASGPLIGSYPPACIKQLYNVNDTVPAGTATTIGIYNSADYVYTPLQLQYFLGNYTTRPTYVSVDGAQKPSTTYYINTMEANLDVQMVYPLAYPAKVTEYGVDDYYYQTGIYYHDIPIYGYWNTFLDSLDGSYCNYTAFNITGNSDIDPVYPDTHTSKGTYKGQLQCGTYTPTDVISFSYILGEPVTPVNYQRRQCNEWMKLALQGISIIFASGDRGAAEHANPTEGPLCLGGKAQNVFGPNAPSNCPYVTSVGGTESANGNTEIGWYGSGGGFSNIFPTPAYQQSAVSDYLTNHPPTWKSYTVSYTTAPPASATGRFNSAGRGYPDVSALSQNALFYDGYISFSAGTSASAPIFAGMITRINAARLAAGKSRIGFLNQILYNNIDTGMFEDIIKGNNTGCPYGGTTLGFNATVGWDPVTGLGTPHYWKMRQIMLALP